MARFCEICKQAINPERAEALPETKLCLEHSRQSEEFGGEFRTIGTQERLNKASSMKILTGGVTTKKVRNPRALYKLKEKHNQGV